MPKFKANWLIQGLEEEPTKAGSIITLSDEAAEDLLEAGAVTRVEEDGPTALESLTAPELRNLAFVRHGMKLHHNLGFEKLLGIVKELEAKGKPAASSQNDDELTDEQKEALEAKAKRIAELEAKGDDLTPEEADELDHLKDEE